MRTDVQPVKVLIRSTALRQIRKSVFSYLPERMETGGCLVGYVHERSRVFEITSVISVRADRSGGHYSGDNEEATRRLVQLRQSDPNLRLLGEFHSHVADFPPSGIDLNQLRDVKKLIPSFIIMLATPKRYGFWDVSPDNKADFVRIPSQILNVPCSVKITEHGYFDRVREASSPTSLMAKTALVVGLGGLGSTLCKYLGVTGVGRIILVDNEELELVNVVRHEGTIDDVGKPKSLICKRLVESRNPFALVEENHFDAAQDRGRLERLVSGADLVIGSSGSPKLNTAINGICVALSKPAVYGGVYPKAEGAYVFAALPGRACFNCVFDMAKSFYVDRDEAIRYGWPVEELQRQQGLWTKISIPALKMVDLAVEVMQAHPLSYNFVAYDHQFDATKLYVKRRLGDAVCDPEGWTAQLEGSNVGAPKNEPSGHRPRILARIFSRRTNQ